MDLNIHFQWHFECFEHIPLISIFAAVKVLCKLLRTLMDFAASVLKSKIIYLMNSYKISSEKYCQGKHNQYHVSSEKSLQRIVLAIQTPLQYRWQRRGNSFPIKVDSLFPHLVDSCLKMVLVLSFLSLKYLSIQDRKCLLVIGC